MKASMRKVLPTYFVSAALVAMLVLSISACAKKTSFLTSSVVPAARGTVVVKTDKNKNYVVQVQLSGLAEVERLQPDKQAYVVWMLTDQQTTKNLGQIQSASNLKASFETTTPFKPVKVFITAEHDADISYPGTHMILTTANF